MHFALLTAAISLAVANAQASLPSITLPWGTWRATDPGGSFYHIPNIRYGNDTRYNRFKAPVVPATIADPSKVMDSSYGPVCIQIVSKPACDPAPGAGAPIPPVLGSASEDCLFLDVYVPKTVNVKSPTTPVVVWIYGGAFIFGSKGGNPGDDNGPFYTGQGLIEAVKKLKGARDVIFVAGNYRLGAFGWMSGPTMQAQGLPNVGIYDQSAILAWVQKYIHLVGGDANSVSVWGESAGASSIMHHLIQQDGKPLNFKHAFLQSPAFEWQWDNSVNGLMEQNFDELARLAGCSQSSQSAKFTCLQQVSVSVLSNASEALYNDFSKRGLYPYGPAVDNISFPLLAPIALESGQFKSLESIIVSHVFNESGTFTPPGVVTENQYNDFVLNMVGRNVAVSKAVIQKYPSSRYNGDQVARVQNTVRDVSFTCNTRYLFDAYAMKAKIPVWMMQYGTGSAILPEKLDLARHASDLIPTYYYSGWDIESFLIKRFCIPKFWAGLVQGFVKTFISRPIAEYQAYLANYAVSGVPSPAPGGETWNKASLTGDGNSVTNVLDFGLFTENRLTDQQNTWEFCGFWLDQAKALVQSVPKPQEMDGIDRTEL